MNWESWFKIGLPALPTLFTIFGVWLYWNENPLPLLAAGIAFWGVGITYYLFTQIYMPSSRLPFVLAVSTAVLWIVAAITSHNLAAFLKSGAYTGTRSVLRNKDFWYAYILSGAGFFLALWQFVVHEPKIVAQIAQQQTPHP